MLGADGPLGRDELLRLLAGGRVSLEIALGAAALAVVVGAALGALAGYFGGLVDAGISRLTELVMAFPLLLFVIAIGQTVADRFDFVTLHGAFKPGVLSLAVGDRRVHLVLPGADRARRGAVAAQRASSSRPPASSGASELRILRTHMLPHLAAPLAVWGTLIVASNVILEAALSFLNLGVRLPTASWGNMLSQNWGTLLAFNQGGVPGSRRRTGRMFWPTAVVFVSVLVAGAVRRGASARDRPRARRHDRASSSAGCSPGSLLMLALTLLTYRRLLPDPDQPGLPARSTAAPGTAPRRRRSRAAEHRLGLDRPVLVQYGDFLWRLVRHGSFGTATRGHSRSARHWPAPLPVTASLVAGGAVLLVLLALPLGAISALRPHGLLDRGVLAVSLVGIAMHPFVLGLLLRSGFADRLRIAPANSATARCFGGRARDRPSRFLGALIMAGCGGLRDWAYRLYLPWLVFALFFLPLYTRMFRARVLQTLGEPLRPTAHAKGASSCASSRATCSATRSLPILPMLAMDVGTAITDRDLRRERSSSSTASARSPSTPSPAAAAATTSRRSSGSSSSSPPPSSSSTCIADIALVALDPRITNRSGSRSPWRDEEGRVSRRRIAIALTATLIVAGGIVAVATVPRGGAAKPSLATYAAGAEPIPDHWNDRMRLGTHGEVKVEIETILVGPNGWAVTARLENSQGRT